MAGEQAPAWGLVWGFVLFIKVLVLCQPRCFLRAQVTGMHVSQRWFKPFSNFGIWDEISWDKPPGNGAGGGFLEPLDPCSLPGRAADPWGRGAAVKHSPVPRAHPSGTDLTEASGDRADFHPRGVPLQLPGSSFAAGPALCWEQSGGGGQQQPAAGQEPATEFVFSQRGFFLFLLFGESFGLTKTNMLAAKA